MFNTSQQCMNCGSAKVYKNHDPWAMQTTCSQSISPLHLVNSYSVQPKCSIWINLGILLPHIQALCLCKVSLYHDLQSAAGHKFLISSFVTPSLSQKPHCIDLHWYLNIRCFKSAFKNTSTHMHFIWSFIMILTNERKFIYYKNIHK